MMMVNASGAAISMRYGLQGPNETICTACAAGSHAIGYAARLIKWGVIDAAATGGAESAGTVTALAGFRNMTALSTVGHQPSVRRRSRRLRHGRGLGGADPRGVVASRGAWREHHRRDPRQREQRRRASHHRPLAGRRRRDHLHATRAGRLGHRGEPTSNRSTRTARRRRSTTRPRRPRSPRCSARATCRSCRSRASPAMRSAPPAHSRPRPRCCRSRSELIPPTANTKVLGDDMTIDVVMGEARPWDARPGDLEQLRLRRPQRLRRHRAVMIGSASRRVSP